MGVGLGFLRYGLAGLLVVGGVGYAAKDYAKDYLVEKNTKELVQETTHEEIKKNKEKEVEYNFEDVKPVSVTNIVKVESSDDAVVGRIQVKSVNLDLPVIKGVSDEGMYKGAGTMKDGQELGKGNYALASHHMKDPKLLFSPLDRVNKGDEIVISDDTGVYTYKVVEKREISAKDVYVIDDVEGHTLTTLITCLSEGDGRLLVQGELVK
ncbi:class A sortase [Bacillus sp. NEAU-Y102]